MAGKAITIEIDEDLIVELEAISKSIKLTPEAILAEAAEYVIESGTATSELFGSLQRPQATCGGSCRGKGRAIQWVDGACPDPCKQSILDNLTNLAKRSARRDANDNCQASGGENCLCTGGTYNRRAYGCQTYTYNEGTDQEVKRCRYKVSYRYENGTCKDVP